jgi:hypothetical protein
MCAYPKVPVPVFQNIPDYIAAQFFISVIIMLKSLLLLVIQIQITMPGSHPKVLFTIFKNIINIIAAYTF